MRTTRHAGAAALFAFVAIATVTDGVVQARTQDPSSRPTNAGPTESTAGSYGRIRVKVVGGKLVAACDLATNVRRVPANLFIDFDRACSLEIHNGFSSPQGLAIETVQPPRDVHVIFPDFEIVHQGREHGDEDFLNDFTKYHSHEIGENAVVGTIGSKILNKYRVVFDLGAGTIELLEPSAPGSAAPRTAATGADDFDVPITLDNDFVWCPVRLPDDLTGVVALSTSRYDSLIDEVVADQFDRPAGDVDSMMLGPLDVTKVVALRPEPSTLAHPDGAVGTLGIGFLMNHRVEVDRVNRFVRVQRTRPYAFPEADQAYFRARVLEDGDATEAYLDAYPDSRLREEAAKLLVDQRLEEFADDEAVGRALHHYCQAYPEDLRATASLDLMKAMLADGSRDAAILAGEAGLEWSRKDRYPEAPHQIRSRLGQVLYERGDLDRAWKHLLSAAFGVPDDGMVNLYLGRIYEDRGWYERAQSRFVQAVIVPESGPQALEGLERVSKHLGDTGGLSVDTIDRLIAGKVYGFGSATRYEPDPAVKPNRRVLFEYFTSADLDYRAALGGALAFEGVSSHFDREYVVPITYVGEVPKLSPLSNRIAGVTARRRGVDFAFVADGIAAVRSTGRQRDAEALFNNARRTIEEELSQFVDHAIECDAEYRGGRLVGSVHCDGPADEDIDLMVLLVERGVLFPGASTVVIHRNVVRALLTDRTNGVGWGEEDVLDTSFDVALADLVQENRDWLAEQVADGAAPIPDIGVRMDPRQLSIVSYLVDRSNGEVLQALETRVRIPEEEL
ncbi:MAG: hypothetical protein R3F34_20790 [Planctomycetota bacterium]